MILSNQFKDIKIFLTLPTLETHTYNIFSDYVKRCQNQMI